MTIEQDPRLRLLADLADPTRFGVLEQLEHGPMTATALAQRLGVSPTQLANHLRRLRESGLVAVEHEGRLAIYHAAEPGLREIFSMLNGLRGTPRPPDPAGSEATTCYDHLAGPVGVAILDHLISRDALEDRDGEGRLQMGAHATRLFAALGVREPLASSRRMPAYACLDARLRRPHLGGRLGAELAESLETRGWIRAGRRDRELVLTDTGRQGLEALGITIPDA